MKKKILAFTLAEILIALTIIGVVAALTIPNIKNNMDKKVVETRLMTFWNDMSDAIVQAEVRTGRPAVTWFPQTCSSNSDIITIDEFWNKYMGPSFNISKMERIKTSRDYVDVMFKNGSGFIAYLKCEPAWNSPFVHVFYCTDYKHCNGEDVDGHKSFLFSLYRGEFMTAWPDFQKMNRDELLSNCILGAPAGGELSRKRRWACSALIQKDGWKIKEDYPW